MSTSESLSWWDRDFDSAGIAIRADVRSAARDLWDDACGQSRTFLGDASEAAELMESSVIQVSRYLDRRGIRLFEQDVSPLLMCAFYRALRRQILKLRRVDLVPDVSTLLTPPLGRSCPSKEDCRLDAEKVVRQLSNRARELFELRRAGYDWNEIARIFDTSDAAVRAAFSRELRRLRKKFAKQTPPGDSLDTLSA